MQKRWIFVASLLAACGSRSGLLSNDAPPNDAGVDAAIADARVDATPDAALDAKPDVTFDGPVGCPTPDATYIYVVFDDHRFAAFRPEDSSFEARGSLKCPNTFASPFSMAIDNASQSYVLFTDGQLFHVDPFDVTCTPTPYVPALQGEPFHQFGMGFAVDDVTEQETLFVADIDFQGPSAGLARVDTTSFERSFVGPFSDNPGHAIELSSGGDGRLWGYFLNYPSPGGTLVRVHSATAELLQSQSLPTGTAKDAMAVAFWVGAFYVFTGSAGLTTVTRFEPGNATSSVVATAEGHVVGAAVAPCAAASQDL